MSNPSFHIVKISRESDLKKVWELRKEVFVLEQKVDEGIEYEYEEESSHFAAFEGELIVGTARWRPTDKGIKLERFAIKATHRKRGIGSELLKSILEDIPSGQKVYLHAQAEAEDFYKKLGFKREGESFVEADILHYPMCLA